MQIGDKGTRLSRFSADAALDVPGSEGLAAERVVTRMQAEPVEQVVSDHRIYEPTPYKAMRRSNSNTKANSR